MFGNNRVKALDAKAANGSGIVIRGEEYKDCNFSVSTASSANLKLSVQISDNEACPDFDSAAAVDNEWDYLQVFDAENGDIIDGDTGIVYSGTDAVRNFVTNSNNFRWINFKVSSYVAGAVTVNVKLFNR
ncbi:MAG: hypothetical protein U9R08_02920 [Nanoarchaeota archaeon]|nr:hypothetical protein [Nanoarchaeota archaeon]